MAEAAADVPRVILCVSGDAAVRAEAEYAFAADVEVSCVSDSRESWIALESLTPDAVIVDMQSGSAGGFHLGRDMSQAARQGLLSAGGSANTMSHHPYRL